MATNEDSFVITAAMLLPSWVKPAILYYPGGTVTGTVNAKANATDSYLPATTAESAGARGVGTAVTTDPNYVFASTVDVNQERVPYPNTISTVAAVECTPTLILPPDPQT
jgi:hypothetical protein